ncbi:MAG: hypothetical protein LBM95_00070 [Lactobacillales bacterium]|jgi:hypothetical protein|nr:hypothetical protein [Lactobacillales bacterium]
MEKRKNKLILLLLLIFSLVPASLAQAEVTTDLQIQFVGLPDTRVPEPKPPENVGELPDTLGSGKGDLPHLGEGVGDISYLFSLVGILIVLSCTIIFVYLREFQNEGGEDDEEIEGFI